ncbi:MAG: hypothetical protein K1X28_00170 [Parachlamydiales bacterium]|nr:hypothetical protein [Parachlamydiales bacterium]
MKTKASALALKDLLGTIEMEAVPGECVVENGNLIQNKPYYLAHSTIVTLALLDEPKSTNRSLLRTREGPIRTASLLPCQIKIPFSEDVPVYQKLSQKIKELKALGMTNEEIGNKLQTTRKTIRKGLNYNAHG